MGAVCMVPIAPVNAAMSVAGVRAEERYGVPAYPGAEYDEGTTPYLDDVQYVEVSIQGPPRKDMANGRRRRIRS